MTAVDVDMDTVVPISEMAGYDDEDTDLLKEQLAVAQEYLSSFKWCRSIKEAYFGGGVGKIVAAFLFRIDAPPEVDEWLWVVTGDIPSCYMVTEAGPNAAESVESYCELMEDWIAAVRSGGSLKEVYPVEAPPTKANADDLEGRINFIREKILPLLRGQGED